MYIPTLQPIPYQPIGHIQALGQGKKLNEANQNFDGLSASLSSGSVTSARSSFNELKKLLQSAGSIGAASTVKNDFDALGKALGSGDVLSARQELSQLQNDIQSAVHAHAPGHPTRPGGGNSQALLGGIKSIVRFVA